MKKFFKISGILLLFAFVVAGILFFTLGPSIIEKSQNVTVPHPPDIISADVQKLHNSLTIMDWHSDSLLWNRDLLKRSDYGHMDIPRMEEGNVAVQMFTVVTKSPSGQNYELNKADSDDITLLAIVQLWPPGTWISLYQRALYQAGKLNNFAANDPNRLKIILNRSDLTAALNQRKRDKTEGKVGLTMGLIGLEGCHALEGDLNKVKGLFDAGYRMIGLHHFFDNELGGSLHGVSKGGLTEFGRKVVKELDKYEFIIDLSHSSPKVVDEVLMLTRRPVVVSHTGIRGTCDNIRNFTDDRMKRITDKGGLIGIGYWNAAVCDISPNGVVKALRYAIDLVGEDHVALGSDFDGSTTMALDTSEIAILTQEMKNNGFTETEIRKVMGENSIKFLLEYLPN